MDGTLDKSLNGCTICSYSESVFIVWVFNPNAVVLTFNEGMSIQPILDTKSIVHR